MIMTDRTKYFSKIKRASSTVIEHLFDNYEFCDSMWCQPKNKLEKKNETSNKVNNENEKIRVNDKTAEQQLTTASYYHYKKETPAFIIKFLKHILRFLLKRIVGITSQLFDTEKEGFEYKYS